MLTQYKNIDQILTANSSISAERYSTLDIADFQTSIEFDPSILNQSGSSRLELHIYSGQTWITGNHTVTPIDKLPPYYTKDTNQPIPFVSTPLGIDLSEQFFNLLQLNSGQFRIVINFFKNLFGSYEQQYLKIQEISPDRTEIALRAINPKDPEFLEQIVKFIQNVNITNTTKGNIANTYLLNFSRNITATIVNTVVVGNMVYVKLYEPLPDTIETNFKCWIVEEQKQPYVDKIKLQPAVSIIEPTILSGPNWQAYPAYDTSYETNYKTWTDLLGTSLSTSQQIVDAYFSGSLSGMKLNIDYSDFNNFIFYSLATERLENYKYKLEVLEYLTQQSSSAAAVNGTLSQTNAIDYSKQITNLVGGFDGFEQFLYYQSSSNLTTFNIPLENATVPRITGSYITPSPKLNTSYPYIVASTTSSQFETWFSSSYVYAKQYDVFNLNSLFRAIPEYQRLDDANQDMVTFVNMLGHHYDILYTYINHMTQINKREENPKLGMPNELLYSVAKQFGWNLTNGNQDKDLWQYVLGTSETGVPLTGSNTVGDPSVPAKDITSTVWRRIVNNLPLLIKSKGTKRSVQALLSCYGIPQSFISINEYGGPRLQRVPVYEKLNFDYALDLSGSSTGTVTVNYSQSINTVELRFRTANVEIHPTIPSTMNLFNIGSNAVTLDFTSGNKGTMKINGTGSAPIELFDGDWLSTILKTNGTNLDLITKKSKYGKIVATVSSSATASLPSVGSLVLGSTSTGASRLVGQLQELRLWTSSLLDSAFENHVKAPGAYNANSDAYSELVFRLPLTQKVNHALTSSLTGVQPASSSISASFANWSLNTPYDSIEETYYYDAISLGLGTFDDNKIRLEDNELVGNLDVKTRAEQSQFDKAPLDSKKLGVYFSPQTMIDEDIIAQFGFTELDQYIGDPGDTTDKSYPQLIQAANSYWKKYKTKNDFNAYISMFTLFDMSFFKQLEQLLPARVDKITGLLIQPNVLERNKDTILPKIGRTNDTYDGLITQTIVTSSGLYSHYDGIISESIVTLTGIDDDQLQIYLTSSVAKKYGGTTYSYTYDSYSSGSFITSSTPYWRSEASMPVIIGNSVSEFRYISGSVSPVSSSAPVGLYGTGSYGTSSYYISLARRFSGSFAEFQDFLPIGTNNHRYNGSKLTGPGFNVNSNQTSDGGPVVSWQTANPNQLVYQNLGQEGSLVLTNKKNVNSKKSNI